MKKLSTNIEGLDELFLGGIQVTSVTNVKKDKKQNHSDCNFRDCKITACSLQKSEIFDNDGSDDRLRDSLVIVIRGARGVHKHLFAMQLMHGLGVSIYEYADKHDKFKSYIKDGNGENSRSLMYYSINKPTHLLDDMYLDLLVERWIAYTNIYYKELSLSGDSSDTYNIQLLNCLSAHILKTVFQTIDDDKNHLHDIILKYNNVAQLIADNVIGYNARTNSIHIRSSNKIDDERNLLYVRSHDRICDYYKLEKPNFIRLFDSLNKNMVPSTGNLKSLALRLKDNSIYFDPRKEFLNVLFNNHIKEDYSKQNYGSVRNAHSARMNFMAILNDIKSILEETDSYHYKPNKPYVSEVVVIDGFSHISEEDLQSLPYNHLLDCLRKLSRISILVFEDTQNTIPDGDIEIEIRPNYDESEDYSYNELRVAKCVNQVAAIGWHLYKRQESRIRIYPSLHLNLFKRSYINNQLHEVGKSILEDNYSSFLASISDTESTDEPKQNRTN